MIAAPGDERPRGTVPESGEQHRDREIPVRREGAVTIASERM